MLKEILGQEKAWCVEENSLDVTLSVDTRNTLPCSLSLGGNDAEFLPNSAIHECGFARVGAAEEGDITRAGWHIRVGGGRFESHGRKITLSGSVGQSRALVGGSVGVLGGARCHNRQPGARGETSRRSCDRGRCSPI